MMNHNTELRFLNVIQNSGMTPPDYLTPGRFIRFPGVGKPVGNKSGWCILFEDHTGGKYGDWSSDMNEFWWNTDAIPSPSLSRSSMIKHHEHTANRHKKVAKKACQIYASASVSSNHSYLKAKQITSNTSRLYKGALVLPVIDIDGQVTTLQFISEDAKKIFLKGGKKKGCFIHIGGSFNSTIIIICEGFATGCTLMADQPDRLVLAALDCHNLLHVAIAVRSKYPAAEIIIAADDDRLKPNNPGLTSANAAALAVDASIAMPSWPDDAPKSLSDFNDLAVWLKNGGKWS
ncbi:hypothetical protein LCGC14_1300370 [marine sediment metagenome]|uniref:Toprim domain-containing protein n=2 Tax=root TaxID=1 RepID=A0A0F9LAF6_9ZZZZ|nr:hypothetical protein [Methylophaga sp.]